MHKLLNQLYSRVNKESWELLKKEAELVIAIDPATGEEILNITTSNPDLIELLTKVQIELSAYKEDTLAISFQIQKLPSEELKEIAFTEDLLIEWHNARHRNHWVAKFFAASCLLLDSEQLEDQAKVELGNHGYEVAHAMSDLIRRLWELLDAAHRHIRALLAEKGIHYPFQTSRELLFTILRTDEDGRFIDKASGYHDIDSLKWGKLWTFISKKAQTFSREDLEKLGTLGRSLFPNETMTPRSDFNPSEDPAQWYDVAILICHYKAPRNKRLRMKLDEFYRGIEYFSGTMSDCATARTSKGKVFKSMTWIDGKRHVAGKAGNRYR